MKIISHHYSCFLFVIFKELISAIFKELLIQIQLDEFEIFSINLKKYITMLTHTIDYKNVLSKDLSLHDIPSCMLLYNH